MSEQDPGASDAPVSTGRTGTLVGILLVMLLALGVFFFWRGTGARDATGHRPPPPPRGATP
ncbi:MAG: hypothetical protein M3068_08345 [Gemmatimonadota bacterium]|nr:hypothetical protein [Gemmatimonadota bacterium]